MYEQIPDVLSDLWRDSVIYDEAGDRADDQRLEVLTAEPSALLFQPFHGLVNSPELLRRELEIRPHRIVDRTQLADYLLLLGFRKRAVLLRLVSSGAGLISTTIWWLSSAS